MADIYSNWDGTYQGTTTVIEEDAKEYHVRYRREHNDEPFTLIFREKKRSIGFKEWK